jgi:hypothetical protein
MRMKPGHSLALIVGLLALGWLLYGPRKTEPGAASRAQAQPPFPVPGVAGDASHTERGENATERGPVPRGAFAERYGDFLTGAAARFALARPLPIRPIPSLGMAELRGVREARIVCLSDPEPAALFLKAWALDEARPVPQRTFSIWVLAGMGTAGQETALDRLKEIGRDCIDKEIKAVAIGHLSLLTGDAETQGLIKQALKDPGLRLPESALLITYEPEMLKMLSKKAEGSKPMMDLIQERAALLSSPSGWDKLLEAARTYRPEIHAAFQQWEMMAAWVNRLPGLKEALRKRLDDHWVEAQEYYRLRREKGGLEDPSPMEAQYARGTGGDAIVDELHDEALLYYWRLGGELKERESKRLQYHGFVGDQSEHLRQVLSGR